MSNKRESESVESPPPAKRPATPSSSSSSSSSSSYPIVLICWNINGIRGPTSLDDIVSLVQEKQPDVLCLQETKLGERDTVPFSGKIESRLPEYEAFWYCSTEKKGYSGTGLICKRSSLSKSKSTISSFFQQTPASDSTKSNPTRLLKVTRGMGKHREDENEGRIITGEFDDFYLVNVYQPNVGGKGVPRLPFRMEWDKHLLAYLKELSSSKHVILTGDLNVAHKDLDVYNFDDKKLHLKGCTTREERQGFSDLLEAGFIDTFRKMHPDKRQYSQWSLRQKARASNKGMRLDYFVVSDSLWKNSDPQQKIFVSGAEILSDAKQGGSDHCPILLQLTRIQSE